MGDNGLALRTKDGGVTWQSNQVPLSCEPKCDKWGTPLLSVQFVSEQLGWVASRDQIARTTDGGETWKVARIDDEIGVASIVGLVSHDGKKVWAVREGNYNYFSEDAGRTWRKWMTTQAPSPVRGGQPYDERRDLTSAPARAENSFSPVLLRKESTSRI